MLMLASLPHIEVHYNGKQSQCSVEIELGATSCAVMQNAALSLGYMLGMLEAFSWLEVNSVCCLGVACQPGLIFGSGRQRN